MSGNYWRSLGQLQGSEESRGFLEREFPEGASELPEGVSRREMMTLLGASLSLATLAGCRRPVEAIVPYVNPPEEVIPGIPRHYATTMPFGRTAYGLVVESHEGRPTKLEGNTLHPSTSGASSLRIQGAILGLYDPDRSQQVLHEGKASRWADFVAAWGELAKSHDADRGEGLAVLAGASASPTLDRLKASFEARYPRARWVTYESVSDENVLAGLKAATGRELEPILNLEPARVILALDADPLMTDPESIRNIRGFGAGRRPGSALNRLYAVEGVSSLTGAMADHRLRIQTRHIASFVALLAAKLAASGLAAEANEVAPSAVPGLDPRWVEVVASDLLGNRGQSLIVAGRRQPPAVHAAVFALNLALGNVGRTVSYHEVEGAALPSRGALAGLASAMTAGSIRDLVVLGANPVYDAPKDLDFETALAKVPSVIALSSHADETSRRATWQIPRAHFLEAWGDARSAGGPRSVVQPLILPLFGARSDIELAALLATGAEAPGYDLVRETWKPILGETEFEKQWNRVLHDGLLAGSEPAAVVPAVAGRPIADLVRSIPGGAAAGAHELEIVFEPSAALHDGRYANDSWLQELPDPITKLTWDNPALLSPVTAKALGVANQDMVRIELRGRSLELPVWIVPGQADDTVTVTLGYGRRSAGRVGTGIGFDVNALRTSTAPDFDFGARLTRTGATYLLATTQEHGSMEGRALVLEGTAQEYADRPDFVHEHAHGEPLFSLWKEHEYAAGKPQWAMTIDLNSCVGCNACVIACQSENNVPVVGKTQVSKGREMHWLRLDRYYEGDPEGNPGVVFQPVPCMQCENAPCEQVCPVAATVHDDEGLNVMVYNRCIGTRYCSNNCPYKVRRFNFFNYTKDTPEILALANNPDVTVRSRGVMEKCTYCVQRLNAGKIDARLAGRALADGDIQTACQQACPASAIEFGDLTDPGSRVAKMKQDPRGYALLAELNTKPRTTYLAKLRNPHPHLAGKAAE